MVLDPLTALSLASNILQVVDFASRVIAKCRHIHSYGEPPEHYELEIVSADLFRISTRLKEEAQPSLPTQKQLKEETELEKRQREKEGALSELSNTCVKIADELLSRLFKHKVPDGVPRTKWKSFREALEQVWKKKDLDDLAARLAEIRNQMTFHILVKFK
jgi:hypothetical protein